MARNHLVVMVRMPLVVSLALDAMLDLISPNLLNEPLFVLRIIEKGSCLWKVETELIGDEQADF